MACCSSDSCSSEPVNDPRWRRVLWIALIVNAAFFLAEMIAGLAAGSASLQADALDFLGDSANYAISIGVAGLGLAIRARAAVGKGLTLIAFALWVLGSAARHFHTSVVPESDVMALVGIAALVANAAVAVMLYRYRGGDANMRSVWICSRNDAIGNLAVLLAAGGVFGTGSGWPDFVTAIIMIGLGLWGGAQIVQQGRAELRTQRAGVSLTHAESH
jgi:Co/Zn/Cd efflux system component